MGYFIIKAVKTFKDFFFKSVKRVKPSFIVVTNRTLKHFLRHIKEVAGKYSQFKALTLHTHPFLVLNY